MPLPTCYLPHPILMQTKHLCYYGVVWAHREIRVSVQLLSVLSGPWWRLSVQLESSHGSGPNHLKFQVPRSRETEQVSEGGSALLFREGRMEGTGAPYYPWGWAQVSRSSQGEGLRRES